MSPEESEEVWSQVAIDFLAYVKRDEIRNVLATLRRIAQYRRADLIRQKMRERRMFELHAPAIVQTYLVNAEGPRDVEFREFQQLLLSLLSCLPERQRIVTTIWLSGLPDTHDMCVLRDVVSEVTGKEETLAAVKRALEIGRRRIRTALGQKGIAAPGLLGGDS